MSISTEPFIWQTRIRFVDTDASGRIHYSAMFRHFEAAEFEFMRAIGQSYGRMDPEQVVRYPRVHVECDYLAALRCDDLVGIHVTVERVGRASYTIGFTVMLEHHKKAAAGKITVACMNAHTGKSQPLPHEFAEKLRSHLAI
jgi:acyl-CoA thioester hydrolase